jgi:iduronate 2-sulfatase
MAYPMNPRGALLARVGALVFATALLSLLAGPAHAAATERPNVLLICVDDLKPILGAYGDRLVKSPAIDKLAAGAAIFDRAYCNQAVCSPSRNALMTGLRPTTTGIYDLPTNFRVATPDAVTVAQHFRTAGWHTAALGKIFHTGHGNREDEASWSVAPWRPRGGAYVDPANADVRDPAGERNAKAAANARGAAVESADVPDNAYPDGKIADEAIERLRAASRQPAEPFFLAVGFLKPHLPFCAPKKYWDLYRRESFPLAEFDQPPAGAPAYAATNSGELRNYAGIPAQGPLPAELQRELIHGYYAAISYMDAQVGRVLDELERLQLARNTIVVLWGDHGWHLGDHGQWCKHTNYEQAARIPLIVRAPGVATPGRRQALVETVDLYPTLNELAGLPAPRMPHRLDGASFVAALRDPAAPTKPAIFHAYPRSRPGEGAVIGRAVRTDRFRLVEWKKPGAAPETAELELYDYQPDPLETRNLATERPEAVAELRRILSAQPEAKPQVRAPGTEKAARKSGGTKK